MCTMRTTKPCVVYCADPRIVDLFAAGLQMDKVYGSGDLDYTSEFVSLSEFFNDASTLHHPFVNGPVVIDRSDLSKSKVEVERERIMDLMDCTLTDTEFIDLEKICSPDNLRVDGVTKKLDVQTIKKRVTFYESLPIPEETELTTLKNIQSRARIHERFLKYSGSIWLDKMVATSGDIEDVSMKDIDIVPGSELAVVVRLYIPFRHQIGVRSHKVAVGSHEIVLLGCQTLADLRDAFVCSSDSAVCQDLSDNPSSRNVMTAKDRYKSGMIFIEDTFYIDRRHPGNIDYSEVVRKWAKERNLPLKKTATMEETRMSDLVVRLGSPYLYQHQGNCEHLFCISDIRLIHQTDPLQMSKYPMLRSISKQQARYCMLCGLYIAKWLTIGNARVPHDPCFFCQACFMSYNYKNKKKIGDFTAYPIFDSMGE